MLRSPKAILALLTALNLLNYVDRFILSAVLAPMRQELHLSGLVAGWLPPLFLLGYFATSPIFGHLGDGGPPGTRPALIAAGIAVWSLATVGSGLARGPVELCVARALVGVGEASYATLAPTLIDDLAPPSRRGSWMAVFSAATPLGSALGYVIGGQVLGAFGWRAAFLFAGVPGLLAALLCLSIDEPAGAVNSAKVQGNWSVAVRELVSSRLYRGVVLGYCAYSFAIGGFAYWAPSYLHQRYGLPPGRASVLFGLLALAAGAIGTLTGGPLADRAVARRARSASGPPSGSATDGSRQGEESRAVAEGNLSVCLWACLAGAPLAAVAIAAPTSALFFAMGVPCLTALFVVSGPINVAILESAPYAVRANAMGLAIFAIHGLGDFWSPPLLGWLSERMAMQVAMYLVPLAFAAGAAAWWRGVTVSNRLTEAARVR